MKYTFAFTLVGALLLTLFLYHYNNEYNKERKGIVASEEMATKDFHRIVNFEINKDLGTELLLHGINEKVDSMVNWEKPVLCFRFRESDCSTCIDQELQRMKQYLEEYRSNCILLPSCTRHSLTVLLRKHEIKFPHIVFPESLLENCLVEEYETPYYLIWMNGKVINFFISEKTIPESTLKFFDSFKRLCND